MGDAAEIQSRVSNEISKLTKLIDPSEIIPETSPSYIPNAQTFSIAKDKHPRLVVRPANVESLAKLVTNLSKTSLRYTVRSQGFGSASASDVLISLLAFDDFQFNEKEEYLILGTGQSWLDYYKRMQEAAPGWTIVGARTPGIGVGGSTLCGGFSWIGSQYGCVSDANNLLDAYVVTADGSHFWASEKDPELLWAMRGSVCGFAIATHFKFRARRFPLNGQLWAGSILIPHSKVKEVARGIVGMVERDANNDLEPGEKGKNSMFLYVLRKELLAFFGADQDMLMVHAFDERGTEAGRRAFKWALDIEGAIDQTRGDMNMFEVSNLQKASTDLRGTSTSYWSSVALSEATKTSLTEDIIEKAVAWWSSLLSEPSSIKDYGYFLLELFTCTDNPMGRESSAWPRPPKYTHQVLFGSGAGPKAGEEEIAKARQLVIDAHIQVFGRDVQDLDVVPNALEDFHNIKRTYGDHYDRLREVKTRVDPHDRLGGWFRPLTSSS